MAGSIVADQICERDCTFFQKTNATIPYITLVMELGAHMRENVDTSRDQHMDHPDSPSLYLPIASTAHHPEAGHPRYNIFAYGCTSTTYNVIPPGDVEIAKYAELLSSRDTFAEHERQDSESLEAVFRMKDVYRWGPSYSAHWVELKDNSFDVADKTSGRKRKV